MCWGQMIFTGAEGTIWPLCYLDCSGALKPHQTFHVLQQHARCSSRVVNKTGTHKSACGHNMGLVVTSTLREFRAEMVRSQLIIVTNSTQLQERLLTEPATCPCRHSLLSAHRLGEDSCAGTLGQGQMMAQTAKA